MEKLLNDFKISFTKGDTYALAVKFKNISADLNSAYFTVKENADDAPLIQKTLGAGVSQIDDRSYKNEKTYKIQLQSEDTANLEPLVQYLYDFRIAIGNVVQTVLSGVFVVQHNISNVSTTSTETLTVEVADTVESDASTTPATQGIEYEQDPVAMAKIGDMTKLTTTNKESIVSAVNEVKNSVSVNKTEIDNIKDGTTVVSKAVSATSAGYATNSTKATQDKNGDDIAETYTKKTDTVNNAKNAEKINDIEITVDENGVLGYLPKIVVTIGGELGNSDGLTRYELSYDGSLQDGQKLYYNNEEATVEVIDDVDYSLYCPTGGAFASASGTTITVALSNQRVVIPQRKLVWSGSIEVSSSAGASIPVNLSSYCKIEVVFVNKNSSGYKYMISGLLTPFNRGYLCDIGSVSNAISIRWMEMGYNASEKTLKVSEINYYSSSLSEIAVEPILIKEIYEIIE